MRVWLKDARVAAKMTLKELSNATGVSFQALAYYEAGLRTPKPQTAKKIAAILGFYWTRFYD